MKNKIITFSFVFYLSFFLIYNILSDDILVSSEERRTLSQFPEITNNFMNDFDEYALDQFAFRNAFRSLKAQYNLNFLNMNDVNSLFVKDDYIYKIDYKLNNESLNNFTNIINEINNKYFINSKKYYAIIPDKSYFLNDEYLKIDYEYLKNYLSDNLNDISNINLFDVLTINDYFRTDTHWRQENLIKVISKLASVMDIKYADDYQIKTIDDFKGVYYGQLGLSVKSERLNYLVSNAILNCKVWYLEDQNNDKIYTLNKASSLDLYDTYLNGAQSLIKIENPNALNDKKLVIYRDSFGSSLIPLLISSYKEIVIIDLRYINMDSVLEYLSVDDSEVLYLYSTLIINNSFSLKK